MYSGYEKFIDDIERVFFIISGVFGFQVPSRSQLVKSKDIRRTFGQNAHNFVMDVLKHRLVKTCIDQAFEDENFTDEQNPKTKLRDLIQKCQKFSSKLSEMGFVEENFKRELIVFEEKNDFEELFLKAKCRSVLRTARQLIQSKDIHEMVDVDGSNIGKYLF